VKILDLFKKKQPEPPKIATSFGYTSEPMRQQAMINMLKDRAKRKAVLDLLIEQTGSVEAGEAEFKRRYPEI